MLTRRRFIAISAALAPSMALGNTGPYVETGRALGAKVTLRLDHPDAPPPRDACDEGNPAAGRHLLDLPADVRP